MYYPPYQAGGAFPAPPPDPYRQEYLQRSGGEKKRLRRLCSWSSWASLSAIVLLSVLYTLVSTILTLALSLRSMPAELYYFSANLAYLLGFVFPAVLLMGILREPVSACLPMKRVRADMALPLVLFGAAVCNLANYPATLVVALEEAFGFSSELPESPLTSSPLVLALFVISSAVIPALVEEFLFRGVIFHCLQRVGTGFAILASAMLFAVMHGNFTQIVFAFPCGLLFAFLMAKTGNIWISIFIHAVNNALASAYQIIELFRGEAAAMAYSSWFPIILWGLGALSLLYLLLRTRGGFFRLQPGPRSLLTAGGKAAALFGNPGTVVFLSYSLLTCIFYLFQS